MDSFRGSNFEPQSLHKYAYANGDPINAVDPTGNITLVEIIIVSAIIGALAGLTAGALIGYYKTGRFLSWTTLKYAIIGLVTGALAGAIIGAGGWILANGGFALVVESLESGLTNLISKAALQHSKTAIAAIFGFAAGFITGILDPDVVIGISGAVATAETTLATILTTGIARLQMRFVATLGPAFFAIASTLYHYITATTFIGIGFGVGFVGGFLVGSAVRRDYDKGGVTRDLVDFFAH